MRQQFDARQSDRDRCERKVIDMRSSARSERERDKEREPSAAAVVVTDALKADNEKLGTILQQQTKQLDAAREEMK